MRSSALLVASWACLVACAPTPRPEVMREVESARASAAVQEAAKSAPQAYADAELRRTHAEEAFNNDNATSAQILSEQALAAYTRATVQARLARAQATLSDEQARLAKATAQQNDLDSQQQRFLLEAETLETRLKVARDAEPLPVNAPASADREAARLSAVKALLSQAKLLCMSARLLEPNREAVGPLLGKVEDLSGKLSAPPAPIDDAVAVRSGCLKELTLARRPATQKNPASGVTDALLAELSAGSLLPFRDDRGVVVTMRALFNAKDQLNTDASTQLDTLGKVAKAHPEFPVLAVVHGAKGNPSARDVAQAGAVADALRKSGAPHVAAETAGASLPVLDPARPGANERNARVEVVFVSPSSS
jgi:outer membrane protein OmpA-like peptidoglycan-associated protein